GLRVSHAVRTPVDCVREAERDLKSLTTVLGARLLAGPSDLFHEAREGVARLVRREPLRFVDELRRSRDARRERFGILHHQQEPELKEALGGVRDVHVGWWLRDGLVGDSGEQGPLGSAELAALSVEPAALLAARALLHGVTGSPSDRLLADVQPAVAEALGVRAVTGWTPEDRLVRLVLREARAIDVRVESVLEDLAGRLGSGRTRPRIVVDGASSSPARLLGAFAAMAEQGGIVAPSHLASAPAESGARPRTRWSLAALDPCLRVLSAAPPKGRDGSAETGESRALETMDAL